ncbi:MAG: hypothetical protein KQH57_10040 [Actinomycetales bacterium]|nr:hypothetical protein [Actinomycetales bacterium]
MVTPLPESLRTLGGVRFGPVEFHVVDDALTAVFDGVTASAVPDAGALLVRASTTCPPAPDADVAARVALAMTEVAATRPDLCTLVAAGDAVTAHLWVHPDADVPALATAARSAVLLARLGAEVVRAVLRDEATTAAYRRAEAQASRAADEAERALNRLLAGQQTGGPAPQGQPPGRPPGQPPGRPPGQPPGPRPVPPPPPSARR